MRVLVDEDQCIGAGQCVRWAPEHFDQDEETGIVRPVAGHAVVDAGDAPGGLESAVRACPSGALRMQT